MMDLFTKLKRTLEADLYEAMETKDKKHPLYKLNQYLRESENEVGQVQRLIERQYRLKEEVKREHQAASEMAQKRKDQAEIARSTEGAQELYEYAVREQAIYEDRASRLEHMLVQIELDLKQLEEKFTTMKQCLKDMHIKRLELMGQDNLSKVHGKIEELIEKGKVRNGKRKSSSSDSDGLDMRARTNHYGMIMDTRLAAMEKEAKKSEDIS
ncbi:PspA/IM30 family protein [Pradoshia sp.]